MTTEAYKREYYAKRHSFPRWERKQREHAQGDPYHALLAAALRQAWDDFRSNDFIVSADAFLWLTSEGVDFLSALGLNVDMDKLIGTNDLHNAVEF
jgi:hypothetical protein